MEICTVWNADSLRYCLEIEVASPHKGYLFSQQKYIPDTLRWARFADNKTATTPELNPKLGVSDSNPL